MSRESLSARIRRGPDDGGALVAVIGIMVVLTILVSTIVTTSLFNVRMTTETRASVQARAAAEAGVDYVRAQIASGKCTSGTVSSPSGSPKFTVTIHPSSSGTATTSLPVACPTSSSKSVVLLATGDAASSGVGSSRGNVRQVEALIESATSSAPVFNAAIYSGTDASANTNITVRGAGADIVTGGSWYCAAAQSVDGNIYAAKDVIFQSGPCAIKGSVYAGGDFHCTSASTIGQNLYVQGKAAMSTPHCAAGGDVAIGGNASPGQGIKAGGNLAVGGDLTETFAEVQVLGSINVGGTINSGSGDSNSWFGKFMQQYPAARQKQVVAKPPTGESATNMEFPRLRQSDEIWKGFVNKSWRQSVDPLRRAGQGMDVCNQSWGTGVFAGTLDIRENSAFDTTGAAECNGFLGMGSGLTIRLGADAVIFSNQFSMTGDIRVESLDGKQHSLYIVTPHATAQTSCAAPVGNSSISFPWGNWTQDDKTSVMLYSSGSVNFTASPKLRGQIYSCKFNASTPVDLTFVRSGATDADPSASRPSLKYLRDITG